MTRYGAARPRSVLHSTRSGDGRRTRQHRRPRGARLARACQRRPAAPQDRGNAAPLCRRRGARPPPPRLVARRGLDSDPERRPGHAPAAGRPGACPNGPPEQVADAQAHIQDPRGADDDRIRLAPARCSLAALGPSARRPGVIHRRPAHACQLAHSRPTPPEAPPPSRHVHVATATAGPTKHRHRLQQRRRSSRRPGSRRRVHHPRAAHRAAARLLRRTPADRRRSQPAHQARRLPP